MLQLESWHKELSAAGFRVGILHLTSKHCPLEDSEPATQSPDRVLVYNPSDKQTHDHQIGPFHPVRLLAHVFFFLMVTGVYNVHSELAGTETRICLQG